MRVVLSMICAALLVVLSMGAALSCLTGDFLGAGIYTALAFVITVVLWLATDVNREGDI